MTSILKKICLIAIFSVLCLAVPNSALARTYGEGLYGRDSYQDQTTTTTTTTTQNTSYVKTGVTGRLNLKIINQQQIEEKATDKKVAEEKKKQTVSLEVKVVDTDANPLEGAHVTLFSTPPQELITKGDGVAIFAKVQRGKYLLSVVFNGRVGEKEIDLTNDKIEIFKITIEIKPQTWYSSLPIKLALASLGLVVIILLGLLIRAKRRKKTIEQISTS